MSLSNKQVSVATTATEIHDPGLTSGAFLYLTNEGGASVFLGDSSVTTSNGLEFKTGTAKEIRLGPGEVLHGIVASGTDVISVLITND